MGIRKDLKNYIKDLKDTSFETVYTKDIIQCLEEILRENKKEKVKNEYIAVNESDVYGDGDTFEAMKDGYGLPPIGYKYVKVWR